MERRSEPRSMCADMLEVRWLGPSGKTRRLTAVLEEISPSGACLQLERPVPVGAEMRWDCPGQRFAGSVRYCIYREIGYYVGVQFHPGAKWSKRAYAPEHLLELDKLLERSQRS
jgi:hypothetical protein